MNIFFFILAIIIYFITEMVMLLFIFQLPPLMKTVKVKNEGMTLHFCRKLSSVKSIFSCQYCRFSTCCSWKLSSIGLRVAKILGKIIFIYLMKQACPFSIVRLLSNFFCLFSYQEIEGRFMTYEYGEYSKDMLCFCCFHQPT